MYWLLYSTYRVSEQVPDLLHVAAGLKEHAAHVGDCTPSSLASRSSATNPKNICEMWTSLYTTASVAVRII